jgi:putative tryptophan/tyrosine transport system substrate-binding protein
VKRREFIAAMGGAAVWPIVGRAQQPTMPVVGFISPKYDADLDAFRRGLSEAGYMEGRNVTIDIRWLDGKLDRVPAIVADLVARQVSAIASTTAGALAAKRETSTIPIVFATGGDPVELGLVSSLNRPGGNLTGVTFLAPLMESKRLGLLHEMAPQTGVIGVLLDPEGPIADTQAKEIPEAARALGLRLAVQHASAERDLDSAFAAFAQVRAGALLVTATPFFDIQREKIIARAARHMLPAIYGRRESVEAGGLMSYGTSLTDAFRQVGVYTGQILKGEKPADMPVMQPTKYEFVINLKTAKTLGIEVPPGLSARADEVIE